MSQVTDQTLRFHTALASIILFLFFFNDTATTDIYTLSLHDALPIFLPCYSFGGTLRDCQDVILARKVADRKSTRLNSSHANISYAVFCLKKKKRQLMNLLRSFRLLPF